MGGTSGGGASVPHSDNRPMDATVNPEPRRTSAAAPHRGFTLIELMVALVVVGIISAVALPAYRQQVAKGRRADAITALSAVLQAQERWRTNNSAYAASLSTLFPNDAAPSISPAGHYALALAGLGAVPSFVAGYTVSATPNSTGLQANDSDCANMSIQVAGGNVIYAAKAADESDSTQRCWPR